MNAGMYGMADGRGMAGRKLAGRVGVSTAPGSQSLDNISAAGVAQQSISLASGVRTKVLNINGKGALRWFGHITAGTTAIRYEVHLDGIKAIDTSFATSSSGQGWAIFGWTSYSNVAGTPKTVAAYDFAPFDQTLEIFITETTGGGAENFGYVVDLHQ